MSILKSYNPSKEMNKKLILKILTGLIIFLIIPIIYFGFKINAIEQATNNLFYSDNCTLSNINKWYDDLGLEVLTDNSDLTSISNYKSDIPYFLPLFNFLLGDIAILNEQININPSNNYAHNLPIGIEFETTLKGDQYTKTRSLTLSWKDKQIKCEIPVSNSQDPELIIINGQSSKEQVVDLIKGRYQDLFKDLDQSNIDLPLYYAPDLYNHDPNYLILGNDYLNKFDLNDFQPNLEPTILESSLYILGTITLTKDNFSSILDVIYDLDSDDYYFNLSQINLALLNYLKQNNKTIQLTCNDCLLAPVSKQFALKSSYAPSVSGVNWSGGGSLTANAKANLMEMLNAAKAEGINTTIISAYRSYNDQVATFNYWVSKEMANGLSRSAAVIKANNYSAYPGQSEHQLGNTLDIKCSGCGSFDNSSGNLALYTFLKQNAYKYGFVISYPDNKKDLTGYNSEPWHIRYVGIDTATKLFLKGYLEDNDMYLTRFLVEFNYF
jgi:D-alanyl-D-alanine carboxypeptidase